jgi:glyoxylase-like metal-dependent hydrolase (beta-lactamase superfamily II)
MANTKIVGRFFREDQRMSESLVAEKILPEVPPPQQADKLAVDRVIAGGESLILDGNIDVEVISAPGHSPCGLACYLPQEQVMMVSDACGFQISDRSVFPIFFQDYDLYVQTIETLKAYPARVLAIAHERIWKNDNVDGFYCRALQAAEEVLANIRKMIDDGKEEEIIGQILFQRYYRGNLRIYTPENIAACVKLLIRRVKEKFRF